MSANDVTRRAALLGAGAFGAALLGACNAPQAPGIQTQAAAQPTAPGIHIGAIQVDTSPLVAQVGNPTASWAQQALPGQLAQALASRMAPGEAGRGDAERGRQLDQSGRRRPRRPRHHDRRRDAERAADRQIKAISTWFPSPTDQALPEQAFQGRVQNLAQAFAYGLRRKLHL